MKIPFNPPIDQAVHTYCLHCGRDGSVVPVVAAERQGFACQACGFMAPRALIIDPAVNWWLDDEREYWHEVAGVFVANERGEFLFFERMRYPFGLTVPAGHVDRGEQPEWTAVRELFEETSIELTQPMTHVTSTDIRGDQCRRGSDAHRWHIFAVSVPSTTPVRVDHREGVRPVWMRLEQALSHELTFATRYVIMRQAVDIQLGLW